MPEQRREPDVGLAVVRAPLVCGAPRRPGGAVHRVGGGAQGQQVDDHGLVVAPPVERLPAVLRLPAHVHQGRGPLRPLPVGPAVERVGQGADAGLGGVRAIVVLAAEQHPRQQERGVDRRQLHVAEAGARGHVEEMVKEPLVAAHPGRVRSLGRLPEPREGGLGALGGLGPGDVAPLDADRVGGEGIPHRGDTREARRGPAIRRQAGRGVGAFPEEVEGALLEGVEKRQLPGGRWGGGRGAGGVAARGGEQRKAQGQHGGAATEGHGGAPRRG